MTQYATILNINLLSQGNLESSLNYILRKSQKQPPYE